MHTLLGLYRALNDVGAAPQPATGGDPDARWAAFHAAMDDDFNTPEAVAVLFELASEVNRGSDAAKAALLRALGGVLGLLQRDATAFLQGRRDAAIPGAIAPGPAEAETETAAGYDAESIDRLIGQRAAAKKSKNYAEADRIRRELLAAGIVLEDTPQGTTWRRA